MSMLLLLCYHILEQCQEYREPSTGSLHAVRLCCASPISEEAWFQKCKLFRSLG